MNKCGACVYAKLVPQDFKSRACWGAPPSATVVPARPGQMSLQMIRPIVSITDDACALFKEKTPMEKATEVVESHNLQEAMKAAAVAPPSPDTKQ